MDRVFMMNDDFINFDCFDEIQLFNIGAPEIFLFHHLTLFDFRSFYIFQRHSLMKLTGLNSNPIIFEVFEFFFSARNFHLKFSFKWSTFS